MFLETQPFYVEDFNGGITDFYLGAKSNRARLANNLVIDRYFPIGKLSTRQGSNIWDTVNPQIPTGEFRIGNLQLFKNIVYSGFYPTLTDHFFKLLLVQSGNNIFYVDPPEINFNAGTWITIKGMGSYFPATISGPASPAVFTKVGHGLSSGQIVTVVSFGTLPAPFVINTNYFVVNAASNTFNLSLTSGGTAINSTSAGSGIHEVFVAEANPVYHTASTVNNISSFALWNDFVLTTIDDGQTKPQKIYATNYQQKLVTQNTGLPATGAFVSYQTLGGSNTYLYAAHLYVDYTIKSGTKTFRDLGPPFFGFPGFEFQAANALAIDPSHSSAVGLLSGPGYPSDVIVTWPSHGLNNGDGVVFTLTGGTLPPPMQQNTPYFVCNKTTNSFEISATTGLVPLQVTNTSPGYTGLKAFQRHPIGIQTYNFSYAANGNNYNSNTRVQISRTTANGTTYYKVKDLAPGEIFYDALSDSALQLNELLYTEDGTVPYVEPPPSKFIHIVNDTGYYGYVWETVDGITSVNNTKLFQSIPGIPGSINATFFSEFQEEMKGISSYQGTPLVFLDNSVYRVEGQFDELGRGGMFPQKISNEASCVSHNSIVQTHEGVFWAGKNGFFFTDGFKVLRVNTGWPNTYIDLVGTAEQKKRIMGRLDTINRRIYWTVEEPAKGDCNKIYVLDLNFGFSEDMPFTSLSGNVDIGVDSFAPSAIEFDEGNWYRGDRRGYIFLHSDTPRNDPRVDVTVPVTSWLREPIIYRYISPAYNFGMSFTRYWVPRLVVQCRNVTNLSLQVLSNNDDARETASLTPIKFRGNITWGDPDVVWGDPSIFWNLTGFIEAQRRFPAKNLRCSYKQIELTNAFVPIVNSDLLGNATADNTLKTLTLINAVSWPVQVATFVVAFATDGYLKEYPILTRNSNTVLTYSDPLNTSVNGVVSWVIRGIPLEEVFALQSYTIHYAPLGKTQKMYRAVESGENASA